MHGRHSSSHAVSVNGEAQRSAFEAKLLDRDT
jgi:hypothetical protein